MVANILIIGASGRVGSEVVKQLDTNSEGVHVRLSTSREDIAAKWRGEGRDVVVLDLNEPSGFTAALKGVDRIFLLTGYTSDMLYQSKKLVDAAREAQVSHIVHLGVFSSGQDLIPHFNWHDLVESYIKSSGISWTNIHPNVIAESVLVNNPPMTETGGFNVFFGDQPQGWVFAEDIAAVAATALREGPEKHGGEDYWLSTEVLTGPEVADILTSAAGRKITCTALDSSVLEAYIAQIPAVAERAYLESAVKTMKLGNKGEIACQKIVRDDAQKVLGRPGISMKQWGQRYFATVSSD